MMTFFEKVQRLKVKAFRAYWQWKAANVTKANLNYVDYTATPCSLGIVLSGGEFTPGGQYFYNYGYPIKESVDYYRFVGMKTIRLPFTWERVQPTLYQSLDELEMSRIDEIVNYAVSQGMTVGIDVHNGGYRFNDLIGDSAVPDSAFADLWRRLAEHYKDTPNTLLMLMSEPYDQSAKKWVRTANAAIAAIREAGATQTIVVPGSYFDGAWTWCKSDNARRIKDIKDPLNNWMIEVHQYMDGNGAGGTPEIAYSPTIGADRLADITLWARLNGKKLFLGEFAAARDAASLEALDIMVKYIMNNSDVWAYATWWGGGDRWSADNMFRLDPIDYANPVDQPQMAILQKYIK